MAKQMRVGVKAAWIGGSCLATCNYNNCNYYKFKKG